MALATLSVPVNDPVPFVAPLGRGTGEFDAYDAVTGKELWKTMLAANVAAPGMSYSVNGKQYIAIYDGGTAFTFESPGKHGDDVYAFALP